MARRYHNVSELAGGRGRDANDLYAAERQLENDATPEADKAEALRTIRELMRSARREQVRLRSAVKLWEFRTAQENPDADLSDARTNVYVLAVPPESTARAVDTASLTAELRKRLKREPIR